MIGVALISGLTPYFVRKRFKCRVSELRPRMRGAMIELGIAEAATTSIKIATPLIQRRLRFGEAAIAGFTGSMMLPLRSSSIDVDREVRPSRI